MVFYINNKFQSKSVKDKFFLQIFAQSKLFETPQSLEVISSKDLEVVYHFYTYEDVLLKLNEVISFNNHSLYIKYLGFDLGLRFNENLVEINFLTNGNTNINILDYDTFFFNLYKSLPNGLGYVSWVDVGNYYKFDEKYKLDQFEFYDAVFNDKPLFYHCVTTKAVYEEDHTKEQLLNCPFIKVKEWEDGSIEMLHYNNPLDLESEENIEQIGKVRKYLSENNLYS